MLETEPKDASQREIHVAVCGDVTVGQTSAKEALERCARALDPALGVVLAPVEELPVSLDAIERIASPGQDVPLDLLIVDEEAAGLPGDSLAREARADRNVRIVMTASDNDHAYGALMLGIGAYLLKPVSEEVFCKVVSEMLADIAAQRPETVVLRFRDRTRRVQKRGIVYVETVDHDQVVHMRGGDRFTIRSSSQTLFDQLGSDARFFKAGSSFIVNLSHVRFFGRDGTARLATGATVNIPVRVRAAFEEALVSFGA